MLGKIVFSNLSGNWLVENKMTVHIVVILWFLD